MKIVFRIVIIVVILVVGLFFTAQWWQARAQQAQEQPTMVRAEPTTRASLTEFISAAGEVEPRTKVSISARVSARIAKLPFKEGDRVTKGDPTAKPPVPPSLLVELDAKDLDAAMKTAEARLAAEKAQLSVAQTRVEVSRARIESLRVTLADAKRELDRNIKLLESKDVSQAAVDALQTKFDQQTAEIATAEKSLEADSQALKVIDQNILAQAAEIDRARDNLSYAVITSPIDGVVTRLNAEVGELVMTGTMNNAGTMIMEVADLSQMILKARVDENSIASVQVGQTARVRMEAYRDVVFEGKVINVALANFDPSLARGSSSSSRNMGMDGGKYFKVEILIDTKGRRIFSGLSGDADIETKQHTRVIKVQTQAVLGRKREELPADLLSKPEVEPGKTTVPVVFIYKDGKALAVPVKVGGSDLSHTVIESGLEEGALVITNPYKALESLKHDQNVKLEKDPTSKPATTQTTRPAEKRASSSE